MFIRASNTSSLISPNTARAGGLRSGGPNQECSVHSLMLLNRCAGGKVDLITSTDDGVNA